MPAIVVEDTGIGITSENQRLLFNDYFTTGDIMGYATRNPFDFNAGGRGFDLLRMKRFSKRFGFELSLYSVRCRHIPNDADACPGDTERCRYLSRPEECRNSGGTRFTVRFPRGTADGIQERP
jgi:signal transduction histidine kinase